VASALVALLAFVRDDDAVVEIAAQNGLDGTGTPGGLAALAGPGRRSRRGIEGGGDLLEALALGEAGEDLEDDRGFAFVDGAIHVPINLDVGVAERRAAGDEPAPGLLPELVGRALGRLPSLPRGQHRLEECIQLALLIIEGDFPAIHVADDGDARIAEPLDDHQQGCGLDKSAATSR
jgi:hypothetical protein